MSSSAHGISADGSVIVGSGYSDSFRDAISWTPVGGMVTLGMLACQPEFGVAFDVSADGSVVVGESCDQAFRWTADRGMHSLAVSNLSQARGVSADGSVVVGRWTSPSGTEAFRWTTGGERVGLGDLPGGEFSSFALDVSADGSVVVGRGTKDFGTEAFRWTPGSGMVALGDLPDGGLESVAFGVSNDGSIVVGRGSSILGDEAFRWTQAGGMVGLADLAGGRFGSVAFGVSADGSVVVGQSLAATGPVAFVWDSASGMRDLRSLLVASGIDMTGWVLEEAVAVVDDGLGTPNSIKIVGSGSNPAGASEGWLAEIPEPSTSMLLGVGVAGIALLRRTTIA